MPIERIHQYIRPFRRRFYDIQSPPAVSVIVPVFNTEQYIAKCLDSLCAQKLQSIEILCIDDGSTDRSVNIIKRYQRYDPRIKLFRHHANIGLGAARNTGIGLAAADYIASVDSDDYIDVNMIAHLYDAALASSAEIVVCGRSNVDENGNLIEKICPRPRVVQLEPCHSKAFSVCDHAFWTKLWSKRLFSNNEIYFPLNLYYQDLATVPRLLFKARTVCVIGEPYYSYRIRRGSVSTSRSDKHIIDYLRVFDILKSFFISELVWDKYADTISSLFADNIGWHARNVIKVCSDDEDAAQYLRHLAIIRDAFLCFDSKYRDLEFAALCRNLTQE